MAKPRSPHYPTIGLDEAVEAVKAIHRADMQNSVSRLAVSHHMGYKSINGRSLAKIGALKAYGLLEGTGEALRVTNTAVSIIADPVESQERQVLIRNLAFRPKLFSKLRERFDTRPSEVALQSELVKLGFTQKGVKKASKSFLGTLDLVNREGGGYYSPDEETVISAKGIEMTREMPVRHRERPRSEASNHPQPTTFEVGGVEVIRTRLTPTVTGMVELRGPVTQGAIEKLVWYLQGVKDVYPQNGESIDGDDDADPGGA